MTRYLDGTASPWYCAAGHGRTEIIAALMQAIVLERPLTAATVIEELVSVLGDTLTGVAAAR